MSSKTVSRTMQEYSIKFRSRMLHDQRKLYQDLVKLQHDQHRLRRRREEEIRQLRIQLRTGTRAVSAPLDQIMVPAVKLTYLMYPDDRNYRLPLETNQTQSKITSEGRFSTVSKGTDYHGYVQHASDY